MNTEERTQQETAPENLQFDAHEFDGLRDEAASLAQTWLRRADDFVHQNPWLCVALAAGVGCAVAYALMPGKDEAGEADDAAADSR